MGIDEDGGGKGEAGEVVEEKGAAQSQLNGSTGVVGMGDEEAEPAGE